jgi:hypothetical protein
MISTYTKSGQSNRFFDKVMGAIVEEGIEVTKDAEFVLLLLMNIVDAELKLKFYQTKARSGRALQHGRTRIHARDRSENTGIKTQLYKSIENPLNKLIGDLIINSKGDLITVERIMTTLNGICPLWPFCK